MHQRLHLARDEAVIDEEVLFDAQLVVSALQVTRHIPIDTLAERQVLCACRRAYRIGLNESQRLDGLPERRRSKKAAANRKPSEIVQREGGGQCMGSKKKVYAIVRSAGTIP
jgi:hypothetical protein